MNYHRQAPNDWPRKRKRMTMIDRLFGVACADSLRDRLRMRWCMAKKCGGIA